MGDFAANGQQVLSVEAAPPGLAEPKKVATSKQEANRLLNFFVTQRV